MSISKHAASAKHASILFAVVLGGGQCLVSIIADTEGWSHKVHYIAAYTMAYLYLPVSILILLSSVITPLAQVLGILCLTWMVIALSLFWFVR
jgi:hypothetical protein